MQLEFSGPGKPTDNAFAESFNGHVRAECLDQHWFASLEEAQQVIEAWRVDDNTARPHRALKQQTPAAWTAAWEAPTEAPDEPFPLDQTGGRSGGRLQGGPDSQESIKFL